MKLPIRIHSINPAAEEIELDVVIDHNDKDHRVWLGRHCFWAYRNGRRIESEPLDEGVSVSEGMEVLEECPQCNNYSLKQGSLLQGDGSVLCIWKGCNYQSDQ